MSVTCSPPGPCEQHATDRDRRLPTAALLIVEALLIGVPLVVLGRAVNWPAGLDEPASVTLPLVAAHETGVRVGYLAYLAYSVLFLPAVLAMISTLAGSARRSESLVRVAVVLTGLSVLARSIGILRWLTAVPTLAQGWAGADPALRQVLSVQFQALNDYGGGIGELLGVAGFGAASVGVSTWLLRGSVPDWFTGLGAVAAVLTAAPLAELTGTDGGALTSVGVTAVQVWFLAAAVLLVRRRRPQ